MTRIEAIRKLIETGKTDAEIDRALLIFLRAGIIHKVWVNFDALARAADDEHAKLQAVCDHPLIEDGECLICGVHEWPEANGNQKKHNDEDI